MPRTYSKTKPESKGKKRKNKRQTSALCESTLEVLREDVFNSNNSMRSDIWHDSFDKSVGRRRSLRIANLLTKNVRAEYNANSSVEVRDDKGDESQIDKSNHEIGISTLPNAHSSILSVIQSPSPSMDITRNLELENSINRSTEHLNCLVQASNMGRKSIIVGANFDTDSSLSSESQLSENSLMTPETLLGQSNSTIGNKQHTSILSLPRLDAMYALSPSFRLERETPQNNSLGSMHLSSGFRDISSDSTLLTNSCLLEAANKTPSSTPVCEVDESVYQNQSNELNPVSKQRDNSRSADTREHCLSTIRHTNDSHQLEDSSAMNEKSNKQVKRRTKNKHLNVASQTFTYNLRNRKNNLGISSTPSKAASDLRDFNYPSTDTNITEINEDENEQRLEVRNKPLERPKNSKASPRPVRTKPLERPKNSKASPRPVQYNLRRRKFSLDVNPTPTVSDEKSNYCH